MEEILSLYEERTRYISLAENYIIDYSTAEGIVQECFSYFMENKSGIYVSDSKSFFAQTVRNRCINYMKRKQKELTIDNPDANGMDVDMNIEMLVADNCNEDIDADFPELLEQCRTELSDFTYELFMVKRLEKKSYDDISKAFRISKRRINFEITKALKVFRKIFKDYNTSL